MGLVYEDERYFSACDVKKFDVEKFDRFVDNLANDIDRYTGDAKALESGYGKYYNNSTYVGKAATASKEFIDRKQFEKFHVGSKDIQRELFNRCLGVKNMFESKVDPSPKARIDNETLDLIKRDYMAYADKLEYEGYDIECIAREIESEYGKYGDVTQPNYRRALVIYDEFCGSGGFLDKCLRKFEGFNEEARQYTKRSMIKEQSNDLQRNIKATATALEGMTVFKTDVQGQSVWLNALDTNKAVVDPEKLAADIKECFELTGIKYDKNAIVDVNIIKEATDLALLNCKSKNEKVALLACSNSMQGLLIDDPMTIKQFLEAFWVELVGIVSTIATAIAGFVAGLTAGTIIAVAVLIILSVILIIAAFHADDIKKFVSPKEKEENSHIIDIPPQEEQKPIIEGPTATPKEGPSVTDIPSGDVEEKELGREIFPKTPADEQKSKITTSRATLPDEEKAERYKDCEWYENEPDPNGKRTKNKIRPNENATESHVVYQKDPVTGEITHYKYYEWNSLNPSHFDEKFGYDRTGASHTNKVTKEDVQTPHVHDPDTPGGVRKPSIEDIPR